VTINQDQLLDRKRINAYLKIAFTVVVWGASFIAIKVALRDLSPVAVVWLRIALGVMILSIIVLVRGQLRLPSRTDLAYFALLGFLGITFHQWLQSTALLTTQASTTSWIVATIPVFMALLGWSFLREKLGWIKAGGIALAALGVLLVVTNGDMPSLISGNFGTPGDILVLISALNWAVFSVISRPGTQRYPVTQMTFFVMAFGWLFTSVQFFTSAGLAEIPHVTFNGWLAIIFLGVFCSGLAYVFWYDGLQAIPASQVGVFLNFEPLVTVVVAAIMLGEAVYISSLVGGGLILLGVWLVNKPARQRLIPVPETARRRSQ
jgi:drug/metabolite transporter (DMT)-like permease